MFIELHSENKPILLSVAQITRVTTDSRGTALHYVGDDDPYILASESYEEVCALIKKAGATLARKTEPMNINPEFVQKAKSPSGRVPRRL